MSKYVLEVLIKYDIIKNLGYFIIDNILDNNIIMALLSLILLNAISDLIIILSTIIFTIKVILLTLLLNPFFLS
jgi:hypothetical protein